MNYGGQFCKCDPQLPQLLLSSIHVSLFKFLYIVYSPPLPIIFGNCGDWNWSHHSSCRKQLKQVLLHYGEGTKMGPSQGHPSPPEPVHPELCRGDTHTPSRDTRRYAMLFLPSNYVAFGKESAGRSQLENEASRAATENSSNRDQQTLMMSSACNLHSEHSLLCAAWQFAPTPPTATLAVCHPVPLSSLPLSFHLASPLVI